MQLVLPTHAHLASYIAALERGYHPSNEGGAAAAAEALAKAREQPGDVLAVCQDPDARGPVVTLPDGSQRARIPGLQRWMWDDDGFAGSIGLRWMKGHAPLPPHVLGHIGYSVVPWKQRRGYATRALAAMLALAREQGMPFVEVTTDPDNAASQKVIAANGGVLVEHFTKDAAYGSRPGLRFRIELA